MIWWVGNSPLELKVLEKDVKFTSLVVGRQLASLLKVFRKEEGIYSSLGA